MEFKKGDRVFHKNLELFGTFVDYAWETNAEADVDFEMEDGHIEQRHVSINQLQKCPSEMESIINELARKDNFTNDKQYNSGLRLIREMGYCHVSGDPDVKYYCICNGY